MTLQKAKPRRPTTSDRRRAGQHHRQSHHYVKTYWPYLPIIAIFFVGFLANGWLNRVNHNVLGYATDVSPQALLDGTNHQRLQAGESNLELNAQLTAAAQAKANDMAKRNYWSHVTPDGQQPWSFIATSGYNYQSAGENLAYGFGTSSQIVTAWMHSAEHRANIMNRAYKDVGFAVANTPNYQGTGPETIVVAMYGEPSATAVAASPTTNPTSALNVLGSTQSVSRLQLVTGATWSELAVAALCGAAFMLFLIRHSLAWRKVLVQGEQFVLHHPYFDMFLVASAVFGFLLSHVAGNIL